MKIDRLTRLTLALIAVFLGIIALRPAAARPDVALAQAPLTGLTFSATLGGFWLFDPRTGDVWVHQVLDVRDPKVKHWRVTDPGKLAQEVKSLPVK